MGKGPGLVVFDLDSTFWDFGTELLAGPPFRRNARTGHVVDREGTVLSPYPESFDVVRTLHAEYPDTLLALASRTATPDWAKAIAQLMLYPPTFPSPPPHPGSDGSHKGTDRSLLSLFHHQQIYPGSKVKHFEAFQQDTGLPYEDMLFFDDEQRNIRDVSALGVVCIYVPGGLSLQALQEGLCAFEKGKKK
ncbi:magnesium-dependent phosphatase-1 [Piptocephalis cylindrospora]|uniref:Magnesium-dependent phosphatase-1 n=1 Tax=Piptocephalis cylindrospora TaxID=1907219 RepID=A0A4P9Y9V0_9FUNG|nr:magnesium-dependent phosphatase-1 [Piptocephalis cylindrospora]|eukprot:RKP15221.1 magnesium-dependent phosphatase-1 [Piptocephalis cylindrospora]